MAFRVKSLLTPFFKIAHPDILHSAPEHVQKVNTSALSTLNSYIDSVTQGQQVSLSSLIFFVPRGNLQYKECRIPLLPIKAQASDSSRSMHLESLVNSITLAISNPETIEEPEPMAPQSRPRMRTEIWNSVTMQLHQHILMKSQKDHLDSINRKVGQSIERSYVRHHPSDLDLKSRKTDPVIQAAILSSVNNTLYRSLQTTFISLDKLFIDEDLKEPEVNLGLLKLSGKLFTVEQTKELLRVYEEMRLSGFGLVVSSRYSVFNVPGALQVPFDLELKDMIEYFSANKGKIQEVLKDFYLFREKTEKVLKWISQALVPCTLGRYLYRNNEKFESQGFLEAYKGAKRLKEMVERNGVPKGLKDCVLVLGVEYKYDEGYIQVPTAFLETQLFEYLSEVIKKQKGQKQGS